MEIKEIRTLVDLMQKNGLAVFKMEQGDFKITLKTPEGALSQGILPQGVLSSAYSASVPPLATASAATPSSSGEQVALSAPAKSNYKEIRSPMVGTFYTAPSPDSPAFVSVGSSIDTNSTVCIIEAMKVMNEIKGEVAGTIIEIVAQNGKPVQFGDVLFRVQ